MTVAHACRDVVGRYRATRVACVGIERGLEPSGLFGIPLGNPLRLEDADLTITSGFDQVPRLRGRVFALGVDPNTIDIPDGFVLDEALREGLVLSRRPASRFSRLGGDLVETTKGPALRLRKPQVVLRLSRAAALVLAALPATATEVATVTRQPLGQVTAVLSMLETRGLVSRHAARLPARLPEVTLVIPAYGRLEATRATIRSALALEYPAEKLDVLVVDDASDPPLDLREFRERRVRVVRLATNRGPAAARNEGLKTSRAELVAFLDNDCVAEERWLVTLAGALDEAEVDVAGGRAVAPEARGLVADYEAARSPLDMGRTRGLVGLEQPVPYLPSCNLLVRRREALARGGFREDLRFGEDVDFVWRTSADARVVYEPLARVVHKHRVRLFDLLYRRAQYASSEAILRRLHPASRRVLVVPVTVVLALGGLCSSRFALLPAGGAVGLIAFEWVSKRRRLRALGLLDSGVARALLRAHGASLFHLSAGLSRYDGAILLALFVAFAKARLVMVVLLFAYPLIDGRVRRTTLFMPVYATLYTLEMTAYQLGVLWGSVAQRSLLLPRLRFRR